MLVVNLLPVPSLPCKIKHLDADLQVFDICVHDFLLSWVALLAVGESETNCGPRDRDSWVRRLPSSKVVLLPNPTERVMYFIYGVVSDVICECKQTQIFDCSNN